MTDRRRTTEPLWGQPDPAPLDSWPPEKRFDDVVVGAGFTGLVTALLLARAGRSVAVLEARHIGAGASGATTAKVSLLQGTKLSKILGVHSESVASAYVEANREGFGWLLDFCDTHAVPTQRRDAVTYAASPDQVDSARKEHDAARRLGLDVTWSTSLDVPFPVHGATVLPDQAQLDPRQVLDALAAQVRSHGGVIHEGMPVRSVSKVGEPVVTTADGSEVRGSTLVLATGAPILDRGLYFAKVETQRSYLLGFDFPEPPQQMILSAGSPTRSTRSVPAGSGTPTRLLVGGNGHVTGRVESEARQIDDLREWTERYFPGAVETHAWAAQDHSSHDGIPYVGLLPRGQGRIYLATGYDKWGMTNSVAAARNITGRILGSTPSWAKPLGRRITHPRAAFTLLERNARAFGATAVSYARAELHSAGAADDTDRQGGGDVAREGVNPVPVATTTEDGQTCRLVGVCTHLGGALHWNDAENTWDCPWHGSRFAADGTVLDGPATRPLLPRD